MSSTQLPHEFEFLHQHDGEALSIFARGAEVLTSPVANRGTAFTLEERRTLGLRGLLPSGVMTMDSSSGASAPGTWRSAPPRRIPHAQHPPQPRRGAVYRLLSDRIEEMLPVHTAAVVSAVKASGVPLPEQRVVIHGAGTAGIGIANLFLEIMCRDGADSHDARSRFRGPGSHGLLHRGIGLRDFQEPFVRPAEELEGRAPAHRHTPVQPCSSHPRHDAAHRISPHRNNH